MSSLSKKGGGHRFSDRGLSASRMKQSYQVLDQILRYAIRARRLTINPATDIELPGMFRSLPRYSLRHTVFQRGPVEVGRSGVGTVAPVLVANSAQ
ncbi:hypothetical protein P3F83_01745 [Mycobacteroides immunogenum]|uniref:hypothetical protein n=1 Tax=Mycobacteroides immunogenum TaxID=83262 RepID=UPI0025B7858F|nr:hypothetical protein [Mycobacteroides immunogenum]WJR34197.1 hypothetical protein P3F83_01745 [Mycobacteroides immunogenum]